MEFVKKNKTLIAVGTGIASVLGLAAYLLIKDDEKEERIQEQTQNNGKTEVGVKVSELQQSSSSDPAKYQQVLQQVISQITVVKDAQNQDCIDIQTIAKILECSVTVAADDFIQLTKNQRSERRGLSGKDYEDAVMKQADEIEALLNNIQESIILGLGISQQQFEQSLMLIIQKGLQQQLMYLDMAVKQQLKMKLQSSQELNVEKAKEIIKYQNEVIETEPQYFERILQDIMTNPELQQKLPQIINTMLCDKVYTKYNIEEEDIVTMLGPYAQTDAEVHALMQKAEEGMRGLLQKIMPANPFGMQ